MSTELGSGGEPNLHAHCVLGIGVQRYIRHGDHPQGTNPEKRVTDAVIEKAQPTSGQLEVQGRQARLLTETVFKEQGVRENV